MEYQAAVVGIALNKENEIPSLKMVVIIIILLPRLVVLFYLSERVSWLSRMLPRIFTLDGLLFIILSFNVRKEKIKEDNLFTAQRPAVNKQSIQTR